MSPQAESYFVLSLTPDDPITKTKQFQEWLKGCGVNPDDCYRVEIPLKEMTAYCFARNKEGAKYVEDGKIVEAEPQRITDFPSGPPNMQEIIEAEAAKDAPTMGSQFGTPPGQSNHPMDDPLRVKGLGGHI